MKKAPRDFPRPRVVVSKCLGFAACRYNGEVIPDAFVQQLAPYVTYVTVCPEVEVGLGVPRDPIHVVVAEGKSRLIQPATGADLTEAMHAFAASYLEGLDEVDGFVLKGRSPSCGVGDVKRYPLEEGTPPLPEKGSGLFAQAVRERHPDLPVETEEHLKNFAIREHFLTAIFTLADFRSVKAAGTMGELVRFHSDNKLLLLAYNESRLRIMGPLVANPQRRPAEAVIAAYEGHLRAALADLPRRTPAINVLMHAMGYFSEELSPEEKHNFLDLLEKYREKSVPLSAPVSVIKAWILRFTEPYLARQSFFAPYPEALVTISESGKGQDLVQ